MILLRFLDLKNLNTSLQVGDAVYVTPVTNLLNDDSKSGSDISVNQLAGILRQIDNTANNDYDLYDNGTQENMFKYNIMTDSNFFSRVWHPTMNGKLKFVFQPDGTDSTNMAIAQFKQNSLKATRTSLHTYDISLIVEECW